MKPEGQKMFQKYAFTFALAISVATGVFAKPTYSQEAVIVEAVGQNPPHFNRLLTTDISTMVIGGTIFETLVRLDAKYTILPSLATAWESNPEATEYRLTLRKGVKWHDGTPFTSADVAFTFKSFVPLSPAAASFAKIVQDVSTPDEQTVVIKFSKPFAPFMEALCGIWIMPQHAYADGKDVATHPANSHPIGTGPFKFSSFVSGDKAVVVRNEDYWGEKTDVESIVFPILPDANSRALAFESGDVQYVYGSYIDKSAWQRILADSRFSGMRERGHVLTVTSHLNTTRGPLAKYEVRKAIYQAIDRKAIGERAYFGFAAPARGPVPSEMSWAASDEIDFRRDLPYDPAAAAKLLDEAGFPRNGDAPRFSLDLAYPAEFSSLAAAAGVIQSNLAELGIKINLIAEESTVWRDRVYKKHEYDISLIFYTTFEDPSLGVARAYICNKDNMVYRNASGLCSPELDADFAAAGATNNRDERRAAFAKAEKLIEGLLHTYPLVVEQQFYFGRTDLWDMEQAHATHPVNWSLVKRHK